MKRLQSAPARFRSSIDLARRVSLRQEGPGIQRNFRPFLLF